MRSRKLISLLVASMSASLFLTACQKSKESSESKSVQSTQEVVQKLTSTTHQGNTTTPSGPFGKEEAIVVRSSMLTEQEQIAFKGDWTEPSSLTQKDALKYLRILLKGDPETIRWYKSEDAKTYGDARFLYQTHICATIQALAGKENKEGYDLILQVAEQKPDYPKAQACAAEALGWYGELKNGKWQGDKRAIPVLRKMITDKDPEIRLQSAGTLLSLGEADIALPILDELAKAGIHQSTFALNKLFSPEERKEDGQIRIVVSHTKLWDVRGKDILKKALNYSNDEVKAFAAVSLAQIGQERNLVENTAINILEKLKYKKEKDYKTKEEFNSHGRAGEHAILALETIKSVKAVKVLNILIQNNDDPLLQQSAKKAITGIQQKTRSQK